MRFEPFNKSASVHYFFIYDICSINTFKKYLFGLIVSSYLITVIGIPVYYHYCGGELEEISYVMKSNSCCGDEEDDNSEASGCCKDENQILVSKTDFTIKDLSAYNFVRSVQELCYFNLPYSTTYLPQVSISRISFAELSPQRVQHDLIISTSVLRI